MMKKIHRFPVFPATPPTSGPSLIKIASGKGGVGKTWFSITLAQCLALTKRKILLFDADLGLANADVQLGASARYSLADVISGQIALNGATQNVGGNSRGEGNIHLLAGRSGSGALSELNLSEINRLRRGLVLASAQYDRTIVDIGAGLDRTVTSFCALPGMTLVVITNEPTSLTDAYALIKLLVLRDPTSDIRIIVNMARNSRDGEQAYASLHRACEAFLNYSPPLAGIIPQDEKVPDAIRRQTGLLIRHPSCPAAHAVAVIARDLLKETKARAADGAA
ncbi:MAG TPA: cobyrinic acid a,c-diamide synthase [Rhizobiales bacterium]|nr:cobyrinic acid a,c-diamide synthase [Hyphomicrobiales bacterium]